ncbi:MAG: AraC family transcriptional regulator [Anaerolineaceae bacterium]|nr:AraC family transcriptional regulator [Anaerolineaceae bacterium]
MISQNTLTIDLNHPIKSQNAGLFISRGQGTHPTRVIESHELILVKEGTLNLWEEDQTFSLEAGQTLHLFPSRWHGGLGELPKNLQFYWIHFDVLGEIVAKRKNKRTMLEVPQVKRLHRPEKLETLFRYFLDSQEAGDLGQDSANLLVSLMLTEVAKYAEPETGDSDKVSSLAMMVHNYIQMNYDSTISSGKIARELGYNSDYIGRIFRQIYGYTITEAIHRRRVHRACRMLLDGDMTIEEIARACGFSDADYFRRIFRRYKHITPVAFRKVNTRVYVNTH